METYVLTKRLAARMGKRDRVMAVFEQDRTGQDRCVCVCVRVCVRACVCVYASQSYPWNHVKRILPIMPAPSVN